MLPQTLEDPAALSPISGLPGDGDPIDALDLWPQPCAPGEVYSARVVGALGMLDEGTTDWKIVVVRDNGAIPQAVLGDLAELLPALESLAGDEEGRAAPGAAPPGHTVVTLGAAAVSGPKRRTAAAVAAAAAPAWAIQQAFPESALAGSLAQGLRRLPATEDGSWGEVEAGFAGAPWAATAFAAPRAGTANPGARHPTLPQALLAALSRVAAGQGLGEEEAGVLRGSVRVWAATRLVHVKEWLGMYKRVAGEGMGAQFLWDGAFLDAKAALEVVQSANEDYRRVRASGAIEIPG
jgi:hypothetical protein